jgi:hypothetical protein
MDLHIKQYPLLRAALQMGLNHIPLKPTRFHEAINAASDASSTRCSQQAMPE